MKKLLLALVALLGLTQVAYAGAPPVPTSPPPSIVSAASMQNGNVINPWGDSFLGSEDSTTQIANSMPYQLQLIAGVPVTNANLGTNPQNAYGGIGGQTSVQIGERQGGIAFTVTFSGNVLNTGSNSITAINGSGPTNSTGPISNPSNNSQTVMLGTVCTQHGTMTRTASGGPPSSSETYTFTPDASLSGYSCAAGSTFTPDAAALAAQPAIIEACRNDYAVSSGAQCLSSLASMVALYTAVRNNNYTILTIPNGEGEGSGTGAYTSIMALNSTIESTYPGHVIDWRTYMVSTYDSTNPVDVLDQAADIPPYSKRAQDASSTLASAITTAGQTAFSTTNSLSPNTIIKIGSEYIYILTTSGTSVLTSTRGYAGTTAATYTNGTAFTGTDALHWSGNTPTVPAAGYTLAAQYIAANDNVLLPSTANVVSAYGAQQANKNPPSFTKPTFICPCTFVNTGAGAGVTFYGGVPSAPPLFNFKNQINVGSAQFGVSADGGNVILSGNAMEFNGSDFATKGPFVLSGSGLGTTPSITSNGTLAGSITVGSSPSNATFTLTYSTVPVSHGYACRIEDETNNATTTIGQTAHSTTSATFQAYSRTTGLAGALTAADALSFNCLSY